MQVLHIFLDGGIAAEHAIALCAAGSKMGRFASVAACPANSPLARRLAGSGLPVVPLSGTRTWYPGVWRRLAQAQGNYNFSIVHTHDDLAVGLGQKCRKAWPNVRWAHTWWARPPAFKRAKELAKFSLADMLIGLNQEAVGHLTAVGFEPDRLRAISQGIDASVYPAWTAGDASRIRFAAIGPLTPDSGREILLDALALFKAANPELAWELRLAGAGPLFDNLLCRATVAGIAEHMALLGPQRACDILPQCDILVAPDLRGEHGCDAIKQAWAAGLAVLCSDLPAHAEMVSEGVNGRIAPAGDVQALAGQLSELKNDPELRSRLARGGRESLKDYTLERMVETYADLYSQLVSEDGAGQPGQEA